MNTINVDNPLLKSSPDSVGVSNNRLVVTSLPTDYGTFAVTTAPWSDPNDKKYQLIPHHKATSFRINNYTGKTIGIRRRHKTIVIDDFEDLNNAEWTGNVSFINDDIEGYYSGGIKDLAYRNLTDQVMLDGSEVEVRFRAPNVSKSFTTSIKIWDDPNRISSGDPAASFSSSSLEADKIYKVIFRLKPSTSKYDVFLESPTRSDVALDVTGEFGTNNMTNSVISIESTDEVVVDPIIYQQKVNYSVEQILSPSSIVYPCVDNISEYEIINLGSDALNYSDTNINVSLSGFYSV